jgi:hypothetical protein
MTHSASRLSPVRRLNRAPVGLTAYHARIAALAAGIPAVHQDVIASFLQAAADAAAVLRRRPAAD